jgi:class 3 adenylate cyclase
MHLSLAFPDPEEERRFLSFNRGEQRGQFWKLIIVGLIVAWSLAWQDEIISPAYGYIATDIRLYAITPASLVGGWALLYGRVSDKLTEPLIAIMYVYYGLCFILIEIVFEGTKFGLSSSVGSGTLLLLVLSSFTFTYLRFWWSTAVGGVLLVMYLAGMYRFSAEPFSDFLAGDFLTAVLAAMIGGSTSLFRERALRKQFRATETMQRDHEQYLSMLYMLVPQAIAERIHSGEFPIADTHPEVTILFADLVGFTELAGNLPPREVVQMLNELIQQFDETATRYGVEKVKTIGDGYMAMCGPPVEEQRRARAVAQLAQEMLSIVEAFPPRTSHNLKLRIGINTGTVVAGVIGRSRFTYDIWGDAVNFASRMESAGLPGRIQVSRNTHRWLRNDFEFEPREIEVDGVGRVTTFLLGAEKPRRQPA